VAYLQGRVGWWLDDTWNPIGGCRQLTSGCDTCWAATDAPLQVAAGNPLYMGTTDLIDGRQVFNGNLRHKAKNDPYWLRPLRLKRSTYAKLGPGKPLLIWACATAELFLPGRPPWVIDRTFGMLAASDHIGIILTKLPKRLRRYVNAQTALTQARWRKKFWLGFSAETQADFDRRWPPMRDLAQRGWFVFVSIAPMIEAIRLPDDCLALIKWVIVSGEEGPHALLRNLEPRCARAVRDQCRRAANIPFFMKQMSHDHPIPPGLDIREFPDWSE
jgi:protein gp37